MPVNWFSIYHLHHLMDYWNDTTTEGPHLSFEGFKGLKQPLVDGAFNYSRLWYDMHAPTDMDMLLI